MRVVSCQHEYFLQSQQSQAVPAQRPAVTPAEFWSPVRRKEREWSCGQFPRCVDWQISSVIWESSHPTPDHTTAKGCCPPPPTGGTSSLSPSLPLLSREKTSNNISKLFFYVKILTIQCTHCTVLKTLQLVIRRKQTLANTELSCYQVITSVMLLVIIRILLQSTSTLYRY